MNVNYWQFIILFVCLRFRKLHLDNKENAVQNSMRDIKLLECPKGGHEDDEWSKGQNV